MSRTRKYITTFILLLALGLLSGALLTTRSAITASDGPTTDILPADSSDEWFVARIYFEDQEHLNAVAGELDVWEVDKENKFFVAALSPSQSDWLEVLGYQIEVDAEKSALLGINAPLDPRFYYYDDYYNNPNGNYIVIFLQNIETMYADLTELVDVGDAWLAGQPGEHDRDMWVLRITNEDPAFGDIADKPPFFLFANIHAREVATPELAIRYIKYLTSGYNGEGGYGLDPDVTWLVNHNVVYVLVMQNPDGHWVNEQNTSNYRRKNMDNDDGCGDPGSWGVDLNRNHNFRWGCCGGSSGNPCSETYRGPLRGSEPETQAFQGYFATVIQDWNGPNGDDELPPAAPDDASGIFISLHQYADEILWPYGFSAGGAPNNAQLQTIGRKMAYYNGFDPTGFLYTVDGSSDDWTYGKFGVASFTYEVGPNYGACAGFFPPYGCIDGIDGMPRNFWAENKPAFLFAHKIARTPYMTAYGPDAQNLFVTPTPVYAGTPVDLTANIADHRYGGDPLQPITGAEYFIDVPGEDGTGIPMSPTDGNWGGLSEDVEAIVDTTGLALGQHYILVHGLNDDGDWGPFTAVFVEILTDYGVSLEPDHASAMGDPGQTLTYTLQVNNIGSYSDTYTVTVDSLWPVEAPTTVGPIDPAQSAGIDILVTIPLTATSGESDLATVTVTSQNAGDVSDSATLTTTARYYNLLLDPESDEDTGYPGMTVTYTLQLTNTGNTTDTYDLLATAVWTTTAPVSLGPLSAGESVTLNVTVVVPISTLPGDSDIATLTATSQGDDTKSQSASLTTTALRRGPTLIPTGDAASADPGDQVTYVISVTNSGDLLEAFDVSLLGASWETVAPTSTGQLAPGDTTTLLVTVTIPLDAQGGASDTVTLMVTSPSPGTQPAYATLTTTANNIYALALVVEHDAQGALPGRTASYTLQLTNLGNITDTFDVLISSTWSAETVSPIGPVAAGDSLLITVNILVPADALLGDSDVATVTATSQGDPLVVSLVQLTTTAEGYKVFLPVSYKP